MPRASPNTAGLLGLGTPLHTILDAAIRVSICPVLPPSSGEEEAAQQDAEVPEEVEAMQQDVEASQKILVA
jgi:hypothetical protein